ncbi:50S ribosomal protein L11 methyltransferase [Ignavibacteria bacterium]|nr:50S ribosomal protein L11 methyltransferase [Bacteroidota bacterium]MCZ2133780.1 50S ribosomal protein L11 methyltransferase [Bacteroidota bacterium]
MTSAILEADYVNLRLGVPEERFDDAVGILSSLPLLGVEERFDELVISFKSADFAEITPERIHILFESSDIPVEVLQIEPVKAQNWNVEFEKSLQPVTVSERVVIAPSWSDDVPKAGIVLRIDPKMSFGTGYHPTTRMMCRFIEQYVRSGSRWIDAGTGTGVLAILAAKLGAAKVLAFDNDEWAAENCAENIGRNSVEAVVEYMQADIFTLELPAADCIAANLYRNLLLPTFPRFRQSLDESGGILLVSGVLVYDRDEICAAAEAAGFRTLAVESEGEWIAAVFEAE